MATGTASAIAGLIISDHSANLDPDPSKLITIGGVAMLGSIPIFIVAGSNKRKANLLLKNETVTLGSKPNLKDSYIAFGFTIRL